MDTLAKGTMSRRTLLKGAAMAGAATTATALAGYAMADEDVAAMQWDYSAEIVVVGFGGSGAIAAIQAHDNGADVLVVEKCPDDTAEQYNHYNSTRIAGGYMIEFYDEQGAIDYLTAASRGATPQDVIEAWAPYATDICDYLLDLGGEVEDMGMSGTEYDLDLFPQGENCEQYHHVDGGAGLWNTLYNATMEREIPVIYDAPAQSLITNAEGTVIGVKAEQGGKTLNIKATKAVILSTGGFEYDFDMLNQYIWVNKPRFYASPTNTGDGIRMAQAVGADLWHMSLIGGRVIPYFDELGFGIGGGYPRPYYMIVDHYGKRYMNENWKAHSACLEAFRFDTNLCDFPRSPSYSIFSQDTIDSGPLVMGAMLSMGVYDWSDDNSKEIEAGWVLKGETIEELAEKINEDPDVAGRMDPAVLAETLANFNEYAANGVDPEFGRPAEHMKPLDRAPYYALRMSPGGVNTFGGPRRNAKGQIVKPDGEPVGHLYGTGEMGSILGFLYAGGGWNLCEISTSGRLAADNAVLEEPWE